MRQDVENFRERRSQRAQQRTKSVVQQEGLKRKAAQGRDLQAAESVSRSYREIENQLFEMVDMFEEVTPKDPEPVSETVAEDTFEFDKDYTPPKSAVKLKEDPEFAAQLAVMESKYGEGFSNELFKVIQGESGFNPKAQNKNSKASGLFQFIPSTAESLGVTVNEVLSMSPAEQLKLYDKYLQSYGYDGNVSLGMMQAAPAFANKDPSSVIYARGTKAWEQNPGWRDKDGNITVASINDYYRRQS